MSKFLPEKMASHISRQYSLSMWMYITAFLKMHTIGFCYVTSDMSS